MAIRVNGDFYITGEGCPIVSDKSVTAEKLNSGTASSGEVLTADGSGNASFEPIVQMPSAAGVDAGHVLTADGNDGAEWAAPSGGGGGGPTVLATYNAQGGGNMCRFPIPESFRAGKTKIRLYGIASIAGSMPDDITISFHVSDGPELDTITLESVPGMGNAVAFDFDFDLPDFDTYNASARFYLQALAPGNSFVVDGLVVIE
jgi:hypothetical protein